MDGLEGADQDLAGRQEEKEDRVREERQGAEPREREAPPAGRDVRPEYLGCDLRCQSYAPTFAGQSVAIFAFAAVCWPELANFTFA